MSGSQGQELETILVNMVSSISTKNTEKIIWVWWHVPVIPATWEAEAVQTLEPQEVDVAVSRDHTTALQPGQYLKVLH